MPIEISGQTYYRTLEVCKIADISRSTFFRWIREGVIEDMAIKDRRGWRLFTDDDVNRIRAEAGKIKSW